MESATPQRDTAWAMSQNNVELALRTLDAFNGRDVDAFIASLSPDVVWEENPELPGLREVYRGRAEVRDWIAEILEVVEDLHAEVKGITELADDRILTETVLSARGKGSGAPIGLRFWMVLWFAKGKITRRQVSWNRDEAREAAGLRE
ncbi:MAG: nuclear transport factor 2 family protein [Solirubrobacterales bacterium]